VSADLAGVLRAVREGTIQRLRDEIRDLKASIAIKEAEVERIEKSFQEADREATLRVVRP
jgi:predicted RNase H-like nuclease (RuvC/YqgF family)